MKIEAWSVTSVRHRNLDTEWHYAGRNVPDLPGVRVALRTGGIMGEGYAPFLPHLDTSPQALAAVGREIAAALLGADLADLNACIARLGPCIRARNAARSAVEMALLDLAARLKGISVARMLGGEPRPLEVLRIIPVKSPAHMAELAGVYVADGYRALKLKASGDLQVDEARVVSVRTAVGRGVKLIVDANQAYDALGALRLEQTLRSQNVWSFEQPVPAAERTALAQVRKMALARIEADEGLFSNADLDAVLATRAADGISLKLARSGGLLASCEMALVGAMDGVYARLGTAFGGPLVTLATATLAALVSTDGPAECAEFSHFEDDEHDAPTIRDGLLLPSDDSGFGQQRRIPWPARWEG